MSLSSLSKPPPVLPQQHWEDGIASIVDTCEATGPTQEYVAAVTGARETVTAALEAVKRTTTAWHHDLSAALEAAPAPVTLNDIPEATLLTPVQSPGTVPIHNTAPSRATSTVSLPDEDFVVPGLVSNTASAVQTCCRGIEKAFEAAFRGLEAVRGSDMPLVEAEGVLQGLLSQVRQGLEDLRSTFPPVPDSFRGMTAYTYATSPHMTDDAVRVAYLKQAVLDLHRELLAARAEHMFLQAEGRRRERVLRDIKGTLLKEIVNLKNMVVSGDPEGVMHGQFTFVDWLHIIADEEGSQKASLTRVLKQCNAKIDAERKRQHAAFAAVAEKCQEQVIDVVKRLGGQLEAWKAAAAAERLRGERSFENFKQWYSEVGAKLRETLREQAEAEWAAAVEELQAKLRDCENSKTALVQRLHQVEDGGASPVRFPSDVANNAEKQGNQANPEDDGPNDDFLTMGLEMGVPTTPEEAVALAMGRTKATHKRVVSLLTSKTKGASEEAVKISRVMLAWLRHFEHLLPHPHGSPLPLKRPSGGMAGPMAVPVAKKVPLKRRPKDPKHARKGRDSENKTQDSELGKRENPKTPAPDGTGGSEPGLAAAAEGCISIPLVPPEAPARSPRSPAVSASRTSPKASPPSTARRGLASREIPSCGTPALSLRLAHSLQGLAIDPRISELSQALHAVVHRPKSAGALSRQEEAAQKRARLMRYERSVKRGPAELHALHMLGVTVGKDAGHPAPTASAAAEEGERGKGGPADGLSETVPDSPTLGAAVSLSCAADAADVGHSGTLSINNSTLRRPKNMPKPEAWGTEGMAVADHSLTISTPVAKRHTEMLLSFGLRRRGRG